MTGHPTLPGRNILRTRIRPRPLPTRLHSLRTVILRILLALMLLRHPFWQHLPHKPLRYTQTKIQRNGEPHQTQ